MKFRKKPVVIDAVQYPCDHPALQRCNCDKLNEGAGTGVPVAGCSACGRHFISTLDGAMTVSDGDWIITGVNGEHYPCKPDIFEKTYEPV